MDSRIPTLVLLAVCLMAGSSASAERPRIESTGREDVAGEPPRAVLRAGLMRLDPRQVLGDGEGARELVLELFADVEVRAARIRFERHAAPAVHWHGRAADDFASVVLLTISEERLVGTVYYRGLRYVIAWLPSGEYAVAEIDPRAMPANDPVKPAGGAVPLDLRNGRVFTPFAKGLDTQVDLMVLWPDEENEVLDCELYADLVLGGNLDCNLYLPSHPQADFGAAIESVVIPHAIAEANFVFASSGLGTPLNLASVLPMVDYDGSGDLELDLDRLTVPNDGIMDQVHPLRDWKKADVVMLMTRKPDDGEKTCGVATLPSYGDINDGVPWESQAFGVVSAECFVAGNFTFAHELGHVLGAHHDWYAYQDLEIGGTETPIRVHAHGYTQMPLGLMTVMAYDDECMDKGGILCEFVPWFSDGGAFGQPQGSARPADNASMIWEMLWVVANYR
jgi:hypothetical protein